MEEDFEDFDPDRSGGELGGLVVVVISSPATLNGEAKERVYG